MSQTVKDWNTKEIRAFKEAFGRHKAEQKERGFFDHFEKAEASEPHYRQAQNLLNKRREHATATFKATASGGAVAPDTISQLSETAAELMPVPTSSSATRLRWTALIRKFFPKPEIWMTTLKK